MTLTTKIDAGRPAYAASSNTFTFGDVYGNTEGRDEFFQQISKGKPLNAETLAAAIAEFTIKGDYIAGGKGAKQLSNFADAFDIDVDNPVFQNILAATDKHTDAKGRVQYSVKSLAAQILKQFDCEKNGIDRNSYFGMIDVLSGDKAARDASNAEKTKNGDLRNDRPAKPLVKKTADAASDNNAPITDGRPRVVQPKKN